MLISLYLRRIGSFAAVLWILAAGQGLLAQAGGRADGTTMRRVLKEARSTRIEKRRDAWQQLVLLAAVAEPWRDEIEPIVLQQSAQVIDLLQGDASLVSLAALAKQGDALDRARAAALEVVFDRDFYFYPNTSPGVSAERARLFPAAQIEVEKRIEAVRILWAVQVEVPAQTRAGIEEWRALQDVCRQLSIDSPWARGVAPWISNIPDVAGPIGFGNFAWSTVQAQALRYDRAVAAYNAARWNEQERNEQERNEQERSERELLGLDGQAQRPPGWASEVERAQVRITNDYRRMFGLRALVWSEALQRAARGHAQHMVSTNELTHDSTLPGRRTPFDRMRREGYRSGFAENLYFGPGGALGAHLFWVRSSGHHRHILEPEARGMASAEERGYWTQALGRSTEFIETPEFSRELWHD